MYDTIRNIMLALKGICREEEIDFIFTKRGANGLDDLSTEQLPEVLSDLYALESNYS